MNKSLQDKIKLIHNLIVIVLLLPIAFMTYISILSYWNLYSFSNSLFWYSMGFNVLSVILLALIAHLLDFKYKILSYVYNNSIYVLYVWFIFYLIASIAGVNGKIPIMILMLSFPLACFTYLLIPLCICSHSWKSHSKSKLCSKPLNAYTSIYQLLQTYDSSGKGVEFFGNKNAPEKLFLCNKQEDYYNELLKYIENKEFSKAKILLQYLKFFEDTPTFDNVLNYLANNLKNFPNKDILSIIVYKNFEMNDFYSNWCFTIFNETNSSELRDILGNNLAKKYPGDIGSFVITTFMGKAEKNLTLEGAALILGTLQNYKYFNTSIKLIDRLDDLPEKNRDMLVQTILEANEPEIINVLVNKFDSFSESTKQLLWKHIHLSILAAEKLLSKHQDLEMFIENLIDIPYPQYTHFKLYEYIISSADFSEEIKNKLHDYLQKHGHLLQFNNTEA